VLTIFNCASLGDGTYYLVSSPNTQCFVDFHLFALVMSPLPLIAYTIGWPLSMFCIFYIGHRKTLFDNKEFAGTFGFLYKRYEARYFWYHSMIITHKGFIVLIKVFLFNSFWQAPLAMMLTVFIILLQTFFTPFASTKLDRMQTVLLWSEFSIILCGILFGTKMGKPSNNHELGGDYEGAITVICELILWTAIVVVLIYIITDILRFRKTKHITKISAKHDLSINCKHFGISVLYDWVVKVQHNEEELQMFREMQAIRQKYPLPNHLVLPYSDIAESTPVLFSWLTWSTIFQAPQAKAFGAALVHYMDFNYRGLHPDWQLGEVLKEEIDHNVKAIASFVIRDINEQHKMAGGGKSALEKALDHDALPQLLKSSEQGRMLFVLASCTESERALVLRCVSEVVIGLDPGKYVRIWIHRKERRAWNMWRHRAATKDLVPKAVEDVPLLKEEKIEVEEYLHSSPAEAALIPNELLDLAEDMESQPWLLPHPDLEATLAKLFDRYDLDDSGTVNSNEERAQLTYNVIINMNLNISNEIVQDALTVAPPLSDNYEWNLEQYCAWFRKVILVHHVASDPDRTVVY